MHYRFSFAVVVFGCLLSVHAAQASTLVSTGNGTTILDTTTGLTWVALSQTAGLSEAQVEAGAGGWFGSYQYATESQLATLFADAGLANLKAYTNDPATIANVQAFVQLFNPPRPGYTAAALGFFTSSVPAYYGIMDVQYVEGEGAIADWYPPQANGYSVTEPVNGGGYGSLLVGVAPVPLPSPVWLLVSGLGGLVILTRRRV